MNFANCAIALGSNLGPSRLILEQSLDRLADTPGITLKTSSSWYLTRPVGPPQPDYLNGCALLEVELTPQELLATLQAIENEFGRVRQEHWGARTLDLDLLFFNQIIFNTPTLQIPHPRLRERPFVLVPLVEIAPHWQDPVTGKTTTEILYGLDCSGVQKITNVIPQT